MTQEIMQQKQVKDIINQGLQRRYRTENIFRKLGIAAIISALLFLAFLFISIISNGYSAFRQTYVELDITFSREIFSGENLASANYPKLVKDSLYAMFPEVASRRDKKALYQLISTSAGYTLQRMVSEDPSIIGSKKSIWVVTDDDTDMYMKGFIDASLPESDRRLSDKQIRWIESLRKAGKIEKRFNSNFFTSGDSREPEQAGILGAAKGSLFTLLITLTLSFPIGVAAAVYLEEFCTEQQTDRSY